MKATIGSNKTGYFIGVTCPGCGSNLEIQEDLFVLTCRYCGSNLRIIMPENPPAYIIKSGCPRQEIRFHIDRYLKQASLPLSGAGLKMTPVYYPYWKINAIVLKVRNKKVERYTGQEDQYNQEITYEQNQTDIRLTPYTGTQAAGAPLNELPYSIGMRAEYIKLLPFSEENVEEGFTCLPIVKSWDQAIANLSKTINAIGNIDIADFGKNRTEFFRPIGAIIYFPYYIAELPRGNNVRKLVVDGITGRVLENQGDQSDPKPPENPDTPPVTFGRLLVELHRCPNCGDDLPSRQSYIYICRNCHKLINMEKSELPPGNISRIAVDLQPSDRLFPFWSLKISERDIGQLRPLFGGIYNADRIVIPGFKLPNFEAMFRLSKRFSSALPKMPLEPIEESDNCFTEVTVSLSEATVLANIIIKRETISKGFDKAQETSFRPTEADLFFAPFRIQDYFYVDCALGVVTFEKGLVAVIGK